MKESPSALAGWKVPLRAVIEQLAEKFIKRAEKQKSFGGPFIEAVVEPGTYMPNDLQKWYLDPRLGGVLHHETRSHMRSDLHRYMFASCFAATQKYAPDLRNFPPKLLPDHVNVDEGDDSPSRTVSSAVGQASVDGGRPHQEGWHYYIHPDPGQCRSLTAREAARLQTFP